MNSISFIAFSIRAVKQKFAVIADRQILQMEIFRTADFSIGIEYNLFTLYITLISDCNNVGRIPIIISDNRQTVLYIIRLSYKVP